MKILGISKDSSEPTWDDTKNVVRSIFREKLGINTEGMSIECAHRIGKKPRPPIATMMVQRPTRTGLRQLL